MTQTITCEQCEQECQLEYDDEVCEVPPLYCPFCAHYIMSHQDGPIDIKAFGDEDIEF